jgi:hypothetical protein
MIKKKNTPEDYEIRIMAMKLAVQHSKNCAATTLVKLADTIYKFLKDGKVKNESD